MSNPIRTMRDVFLEKIYQYMKENGDIFFLTADFGSPVLDKLSQEFNDRCINVGIAEQNLVNVATGLSLEGFTVYAYAIAPFISMRCFEQTRTNLSIQSHLKSMNVNLIGVGAGLSYNLSGPTHHCYEDVALMRLLPNFTVFSPSDWVLAELFFDYSINVRKPKYIRFDAKPLESIYHTVSDLSLEDGFYEFIKGDKIAIVATGFMTHRALEVANEIKDIGVIDMFFLKPINAELLFATLTQYDVIITLEESFINVGGLDSIILKVLNDFDSHIKVKNLGINDEYVFDLGNRDYLHKIKGLDQEGITKIVHKIQASSFYV